MRNAARVLIEHCTRRINNLIRNIAMKNTIFILCLLFFCTTLLAQSFEGEIDYSNSYKSKIPGLADERMTVLLGTKQEYFISGGNYKSIVNGQAYVMQLYDYKTNRLYNKTPKSDTLYWLDASVNTDSVFSYEIKKNAVTILGYQCDEMILYTKAGTTTFYFTAKLALESEKYKNHNYGNWSFFATRSNSLPLKILIESDQFIMESTAIEVKPLKLNKEYFAIDSKTPIKRP